ncbi:hypothetical protein B5F40_00100 [Gordonibacter sp. An230]|uniref:hypothetical protein n=1 Tax=Gordonibacter sp. An230 TaxID=1965592 RepID=UPI000B3A0986|nr:hypothetical protein [Gordonibacter sp. An230]OUO92356.1 hypothetical protein B5F40_00100 [Gordonibacter sp. An230]
MHAEQYFGSYARFDTKSKKDAASLLSADNLVGDAFDIVFLSEEGSSTAWLKNRFGNLAGFFDAEFSRKLRILSARGWILKAFLSFVAFTDSPEPGHYWGEAAVICYDPSLNKPFSHFESALSQRLANGVRPDIALGEQGVEHIVRTDGTWQPKSTLPFPEKTAGTVILKSRRKLSESLIEQGRKGNKGCYLVSWVFLLALVAVVLFTFKTCGVF